MNNLEKEFFRENTINIFFLVFRPLSEDQHPEENKESSSSKKDLKKKKKKKEKKNKKIISDGPDLDEEEEENVEENSKIKKKKKKRKNAKEEISTIKKVKKAKRSSSSNNKAEANEQSKHFDENLGKHGGIEQQPLPSKLMRMAGYDEKDENVLGSSHETNTSGGSGISGNQNRKRKRDEPRSPSYDKKLKPAKSARPPRTPPEPRRSMSPPTDPRLRNLGSGSSASGGGLPRLSGPRTPSPPMRSKTGPRTPSPTRVRKSPLSPPSSLPTRYQQRPSSPRRHSKSPSPRYRGQMSPPPLNSSRGGRGGIRSPASPMSPPPRGSRRAPPRGGRSPSPLSPKRSSRHHRGSSPRNTRPRSPNYRHHRGHSSPHSPSYSRSRYGERGGSGGGSEPTFRLERSVADSTINDADLMRPYGSSATVDPYYAVAGLDVVSAGVGLIADTNRQNSPKRPSLDERLEKELGIKMGDGGADHIPDFSKPPPGYPARLIPQAAVSPQVMPGAKLGHIPSYSQQENKSISGLTGNAGGLEAAASADSGRHLRVGNMLQIIPTNAEQKQHLNDHNIHSKHSPKPVVSPMASSAASFLLKIKNKNPEPEITGSSVAQQEEIKAKELLRKKLEEQKKQKEAERRLRREQRLAELQKKELLEAEQNKKQASEDLISRENKKQSGTGSSSSSTSSNTGLSATNSSGGGGSGRILETIEREEEDHEARILAEAMTSVPDDDHELIPETEVGGGQVPEVDIQGMTSAERRSKSKKKDHEVRYISLKPLSKKERKRQAKNLEASQETIEEFEEDDEDFVKRSPVPLPDSSTVKSILHAVGYSSSKDTTKKVLKYADGVLPGQGSPDHHNDVMETSPPALQSNR